MGETHGELCDGLLAPTEQEATTGEATEETIGDGDDPGRDDDPGRGEGDGDGDGEQQVEEAEPFRKAMSPIMPPAAEVEEHRITHIPYRSWCKECNMGRGL